MKDQPAEIPTQRIPCQGCGAKILPLTAQFTGGYCMPCANARMFVTGSPGPGPGPVPVPPTGSICYRCGADLPALPKVMDRFCKSCAEVHPPGGDGRPHGIQYQLSELDKFVPPAARRISKLLAAAGIPFQTADVFRRVPHRDGPITEPLVSIVVRFEDGQRAWQLVRPDLLPANAIRNCTVQLQYVCPRNWDQLEPTAETGTRFCMECEKKVFLCLSDFDALNHARQGHCIALPGKDGTAEHLLRNGMPPPLTEEQKARYVAYRVDQAKTTALRQLTDSSSFCSVCGYPLDIHTSKCIVCAARQAASIVYRP